MKCRMVNRRMVNRRMVNRRMVNRRMVNRRMVNRRMASKARNSTSHRPLCLLWLLLVAGLAGQASCSSKDRSPSEACQELLACCERLAPTLQPQCRSVYDQWQGQQGADEQCQRTIDDLGPSCRTSTPTDDGGGPAVDGGGSSGCTGLRKSQGLSQPCCPGFGVDACGAGLFCAAFDGRTQPTCYAEGSRKDLESCTADKQCQSGSCETKAGRCQSVPGGSCDPAIGCVTVDGKRYGCDERSSTKRCTPLGDGTFGSFCLAPEDCRTAWCDKNQCGCKSGEHVCGERCVSNTAIATCGTSCTSCPTPTNGKPTCNGSFCGVQCESGYTACGSKCVSNLECPCNGCDDGNPCTVDTCNAGSCSHTPSSSLASCGYQGRCYDGVCKTPIAYCIAKDPGEYWTSYYYYDATHAEEWNDCLCDGNVLRAARNGSLGYLRNVPCKICVSDAAFNWFCF